MGVFDFTCCVSQLPIGPGDPVRYFLLVENSYKGGIEGISDRYFIRTLPIRAKYDAYGSVTEVHSDDLAIGLTWLELLTVDVIECVPTKPSEASVSRALSWDAMRKAVWERRLSVGNAEPTKPPLRVEQAMIREDVWQKLCTTHVPGRTPDEIEIHFQKAVSNAIEEATSRRERSESIARLRACIQEDNVAAQTALAALEAIPPRGVDMGTRLGDSPLYSPGPGSHVWQMILQQRATEGAVQVLTELFWLSLLLNRINYQWRPSYSAGLQQGDWSAHLVYHTAMQDVAGKIAYPRDPQ